MTVTSDPGIPFVRYLDKHGAVVNPLPVWADNLELLRELYRQMVLVRVYDKKAIALQRTGRLGTYPSHLGAEAIGIGIGKSMATEDVYVPYYRDMPTLLMRGVPMLYNLLYWGGDERGSCFPEVQRGERLTKQQDFPICVPIATQCSHACGVATAFKIRGEKRVAVTSIGDGGTSKGDFLESLNCAGVWHLPLVFVINNNQWAISVPRKIQSSAPTLAQKGVGAGLPCLQVDGNDVIAVYDVVSKAIERARVGKGATVIEAISYRLGDHTTADDASRYRDAEELEQAWQREPVARMRGYLSSLGVWSDTDEATWLEECDRQVSAAVEEYEKISPEPPECMFDSLYASLPADLASQRQQLINRMQKKLALTHDAHSGAPTGTEQGERRHG